METHVYDGDGVRVRAVITTPTSMTSIYVGNYFELTSGITRTYYYAGNVRVAERYSNTLYYLLTDHLGSTAVTTDASGNRVTELRYYPYGGDRYNGTNQKTTYRFTGQRWDPGTALYFYGSRWYDPVIGRFLSADTIVPQPGNPQSLNRYSYVGNRPTVFVDPTGHAKVCGTDVEGGGCGEWSVYTHSIVGNPLVGVDPELLEQVQAVSAANRAEIRAGMDRALAEAQRVAKRVAKEQIRYEIKKNLPPSGAASMGGCGTLGIAGYGTACVIVGAADSKGNVIIGGWALGGGGVMIFTGSVTGNVTWYPQAGDVSQVGGKATNLGIGAGEIVVGGVDWVASPQSNGEYLQGISVNFGVGLKDSMAVLPGEVHAGGTNTHLSQWRFNVWEFYDALLGDW